MKYTKSLKGNVNFKRAIKQGKYACSENLSIHIKPNEESINRLGICVSKKHGNSVIRNKLKRWVREGYYELEPKLKLGNNIIIIYRKNINIEKINYLSLKGEISDLFIKMRLYYE